MVTQDYEAVTSFYARPGAQLRLVDTLTIGDARSEEQHNYSSTDAAELYSLTSAWVGGPPASDSDSCTAPNPTVLPTATVSVREIKGTSTMTMGLAGRSRGEEGGGDTGSCWCRQVMLRRTMDFECFNQQAGAWAPDGFWPRKQF